MARETQPGELRHQTVTDSVHNMLDEEAKGYHLVAERKRKIPSSNSTPSRLTTR